MGEVAYKGKGVAKEASQLILDYGFNTLGLNRIYLFTEIENLAAQHLFETVGFKNEGIIREDIFSKERYVDRIMYGMLRTEFRRGYFSSEINCRESEIKVALLAA